MELVIATRNPGKLKEIRDFLSDFDLTLHSLDEFPRIPEIEETGGSFEENALRKARGVAAATGKWALADDSGLEVATLGYRPGIYSARYAGPQASAALNNQRLLEELAGVPLERRQARYRCVIALAHPGGRELVATGSCEGLIGLAPRGRGGFGYDPLVYLPRLGKTFAELEAGEKARYSHRGAALRALCAQLPEFLKK